MLHSISMVFVFKIPKKERKRKASKKNWVHINHPHSPPHIAHMAISIETIAHFLWCMLPQPYPLYCTYICDEHVSCCMCIGRNFNSGRDDDDDNNNSSIPGAKLYGWYCRANRFMSHNDAIHWHQQFDCTRTHIPLHSTRIQMCMCEWSVGSKKMPMCECWWC